FLRGGDHLPFSREGFTAIRITEMNEHFRHQPQDIRTEDDLDYGDLPELVDFEYLRKVTAMNLATLANLAASPGPPRNAGVLVAALSNETVLTWDTPVTGQPAAETSSPDSGSSSTNSGSSLPAAYYVLIRETSGPVWQKKIRVEGTSATLPYSKDNYFFAVQA